MSYGEVVVELWWVPFDCVQLEVLRVELSCSLGNVGNIQIK